MHIFVIGAGPAGLTAAITAARNNINVTIIERNNKVGKKLLLTGNGRCNFYNEDQSLSHYHSTNLSILSEILKHNHILEFIDSLGIVYKSINGYYYPYSDQSTSIVNALYETAKNLHINFIFDEQVISIKKETKFIISTTTHKYQADKVIIACGSKAAPKTGSDGNAYNLVTSLGHSLIKPLPALVQLQGKDNYYKDWEGVRAKAILSLYEDNNFITTEEGEVQLTSYGLSGICTMNLSSIIAKGLDQNKKEEIQINFVPWLNSPKELITYLNNQEQLTNYNLSQLLECFLNYKLVNLIIKLLHLSKDTLWSNSPKSQIADLLMAFPFPATATNSFDQAQVCSGGIPLSEINPATMESTLVKDLYLVGEILDVDGTCGGYNLTFAWLTGMLAGMGCSK